MVNRNTPGTIKSGEQLLEVVQALQKLGGAGVTELGEYLDMEKSHVHKYLKTLEQTKYVDNTDGEYALSFMFITHAEHVKKQSKLCQVAKNRVEKMANNVDDVVKFSVKQGNYSIGVYINNDSNMFQVNFLPGRREYLHQSAPGKAMLAEESDERIRAYVEETGLPPREDDTVTTAEELFAEVSTIRDRGFAISSGEWHEKINGIGAVITGPTGKVGAINVFGPAASLPEEYLIEEYGDDLLRITSQIEHKVEQEMEA
ncbi:IclR family transcriptional regulator [Haloplanus natans]|uniref:IclR family transcriptional regulator n=1 Tax=Haloplanus natans TaxID=376171 RepID=UPI0006778299|nr:IclR family transcriptional regulator [Haloplanus natans]